MDSSSLRRIGSLAVLLAASCSPSNPVTTDGGDSAADVRDVGTDQASDTRPQCVSDNDCTDGVFCNGAERCMPGGTGADARGCVAATPATPCSVMQTCNEAARMCSAASCEMPDADGDGHRSMACGGDDCDDNDANRFPGNPEVCDTMMHDEDCNPATYTNPTTGDGDRDMDGYVDRMCCNVDLNGMRMCGLDCDDTDMDRHPGLLEICDGKDNDCDGMVDNLPAAGANACALGTPDRACTDSMCGGTAGTQSCTGCQWGECVRTGGRQCAPGAVQTCMTAGHTCAANQMCATDCTWNTCAYPAETCDYDDDDCDGLVDDGVTANCDYTFDRTMSLPSWMLYGGATYDSVNGRIVLNNGTGSLHHGASWITPVTVSEHIYLDATVTIGAVTGYRMGDGFALLLQAGSTTGVGSIAYGLPGAGYAFAVTYNNDTWPPATNGYYGHLRIFRLNGSAPMELPVDSVTNTQIYTGNCPATGTYDVRIVAHVYASATSSVLSMTMSRASTGLQCAVANVTSSLARTELYSRPVSFGITASSGDVPAGDRMYTYLRSLHTYRENACNCLPY